MSACDTPDNNADHWESLLDRPYRRPERELPFYGGYLSALVDGQLVKAGAEMGDPCMLLIARESAANARVDELLARRMLRSLPPIQRALLRMRFGFGGPALTQRQAAERLGLSRRTVQSYEKAAISMLRSRASSGRPVRSAA